MISQHTHPARHFFAIGRDGAGFAASAEILSGIKAKRCGVAHRARLLPAIFFLREILRAVGLASIFHHDQIVTACHLENGIHIGALPVDVHRHHRGDRCAIVSVVRLSRLAVHIAFPLEIFPQLRDVHRIGLLFDINEIGPRAGLADRFRGSNKGVRHRHHDVAWLHSCSHQSKADGVSAVGYTNAMLGVTERREFVFKILDHRTADETSRAQHFLENSSEFRLELLVRRDQDPETEFFR